MAYVVIATFFFYTEKATFITYFLIKSSFNNFPLLDRVYAIFVFNFQEISIKYGTMHYLVCKKAGFMIVKPFFKVF